MAAYAALVSLKHILEQISARYPARLNKDLIESLDEKVGFLQEFLENYSQKRSEEIESFESQIRELAYHAEDYVEDQWVQFITRSTAEKDEVSADFCRDLLKIVENFDSIKKEVIKNIEENTVMKDREPEDSKGAASLRSDKFGDDIVVGFEEYSTQLMDALTGPQSSLQIVSIVGMGGIGKTTLARAIYDNEFIVERFDVRAWFAVSREEFILGILQDIAISVGQRTQESEERLETGQDLEGLFDVKAFNNRKMRMTDHEIGEKLHKILWGRKYFIVLDDVWSSESWSKTKRFFPENKNGSGIITTTRLSDVAKDVSSRSPIELALLSMDKSWEMLCKYVFGQEDCPSEWRPSER